jgi:hypothetical protein
LNLCCAGITDQIKHDLKDQSQDFDKNERIEILQTVLVLRDSGEIFFEDIPPTGTPIYWKSLNCWGFSIYGKFNYFTIILPENKKKEMRLVC